MKELRVGRLVGGMGGLGILCLGVLVGSCSRPEPSWAQYATESGPSSGETYDAKLSPPVREGLARAVDPRLTAGTLDNGLTYYVLELPGPVQEVAVWLGVDVGSLLETDEQRGYAHFVEHMAFNGTRSFPGGSMSAFMQRAGMTLGGDINAFTSADSTVYQFMVPPDEPEVFQTSLRALRGIASEMTFASDAVDKERKIVLEELRLQPVASESSEILEKRRLTAGTPYADREPIGLASTLRGATAAKLKEFYETWYTPSRMAVVVVGDDRIQGAVARIKQVFGDMRSVASNPPRSRQISPAAPESRVFVSESQTAAVATLRIVTPTPRPNLTSRADAKAHQIGRICESLLVRRLSEVSDEPSSAVGNSRARAFTLNRQTRVRMVDVGLRNSFTMAGIIRTARELERIRRHGYLASELEDAVQLQSVRALRSLSRWAHAQPGERAEELLRNYFEGERVPGIEAELHETIELFRALRHSDFDVCKELVSPNSVVSLTVPRWEQPPAKADVEQALVGPTRLRERELGPWQSKGSVTSEFRAIRLEDENTDVVVSSQRDEASETDVWVLKNGVRVVLKPTPHQRQTIRLEGLQAGGWGGLRGFDPAHIQASVALLSGIGSPRFSSGKLLRVLASEDSSFRIGVGEHSRWFSAVTHERALDIVLKAIAMRLTEDPYAGEDVTLNYSALRHRLLPASSAESIQRERVAQITRDAGPLGASLTDEQVTALGVAGLQGIWKALYSDQDGLTIAITGDFEPRRIRPMVERYLGTLRSRPIGARTVPIVPTPTPHAVHEVISANTPRSQVWMNFATKRASSEDARRDALIVQHVLRLRLFATLREATGNVYSIQVTSRSLAAAPSHRVDVSFNAAPGNVAGLKQIVLEQLDDLARTGPTEDELHRTREALRRQIVAFQSDNDAWLDALLDHHVFGFSLAERFVPEATLRRITRANVQQLVAALLAEGEHCDVVVNPDRPTSL